MGVVAAVSITASALSPPFSATMTVSSGVWRGVLPVAFG